MNLSEELISGSAVLNKLADSDYSKLLRLGFDIILRRRLENSLEGKDGKVEFESIDKLILKQAYAALVGIILEAGRENVEPIGLRGILADHNIQQDRIDLFVEQYEQEREALIQLLTCTSFTLPHIVGIDWRLNQFLKSNSVERENRPVYFLNLFTQKPTQLPYAEAQVEEGENKQVNGTDQNSLGFSCSIWELLDLQTKLRDAAKQFERITHT